MGTDDALVLQSAIREVSEAISRLERIKASFSTDSSFHSLAQPIRELTEAIRGGLQPRQASPEHEAVRVPVKDRLWRTKDLAAFLGTSAIAALKLSDRHGIPHMRLGRTRLYDPAVVKRWLAGEKEKGNVRS